MRQHLPALSLPCLVITTTDNGFVPPILGRWLADHIAGAELCEIDAQDDVIWAAAGPLSSLRHPAPVIRFG
jgi:hypothetical protein